MSRIDESKYRQIRIDRRDAMVNKFLDEAIANKKSITRALQDLIDHNSLLKAQLRQNEIDTRTIHELIDKIPTIFAANRNQSKPNDAIEETEREQAEIHLKGAVMIKGKS
jgi:hypothetical protein